MKLLILLGLCCLISAISAKPQVVELPIEFQCDFMCISDGLQRYGVNNENECRLFIDSCAIWRQACIEPESEWEIDDNVKCPVPPASPSNEY